MVKFIGLKMQGIRSISDTPQCINFLTPLTIIQGPNGTGKTTIIEALNYVTTGALPAGKMQTFIHNTQLSNRSRVDALVQLVFVDIRGNKCIATKRMNASASNRGQGKLTTKSDEFTLRIEDKFGNPKSISSKVVDFNKEMLNLLGVPKAVLEYVLFCHQEESNWPLSEPKELKMRFDAIFEVTKYVKALETVKKNIKELHVQIQGVDKELPHLENNLRANADLRLKYHDASTALKHNKKTIEQLGTEKEAHDRELMATRRQVELAVKANNEFEILQGQINTHRRLIDSMPAAEYPGTLEQLKQAIETLKFSSAIIEAEEQRASITRQLHTITYEIDRCKKAEEACRTTMMHHMARQEAMQNREAEYLTLLQQCASKFDITVDPNFVDSLENKLKLIEEEVQKFKQTEMDRIRGLGDSIEKARTKFAELKSSSQSRRQECAKLSQSISQAEREVKSSGNTSQVVDKLTQDIAKLEVQLKSLSDFKLLDTVWESLSDLQLELNALKMDMIELGDNDSVEHVRDKATSLLDKAGENLNATMANVDMLKKRVKIINQLAEFKDRKAAANERLVQLETLKLSIQEKSEQIKELEQLMTTAGRELPNVEKELRTLEQAKEKLVASMHQRERDFFNQMDSIRAAIQKIEQMKTAITRDKESASVPSDISEKLEQQKSQIERLLAEKSQLEKKMDGADVHKHELRVMEEQLRRMELERDLEKLRLQLEEKKENAALTGVEDLADLRKKEQRVNHNCVETNNQIHQRNGEQLQMKKRLADLKQQLEERRYADAKQLYMDKLVERSITTAAIEDLEKYYKIVDNAIINFHQQKMEQINQILRELWTRVYQGNDIETIKIKSQPVSGGEKKKSYDYSVVMTVDQTDIDMRDRCSAGQKVLASILIRIALADVFAGSCRILALDEPTTNLDADKVENIGTMLKNLIEIQTLSDDGNGAIGAAQLHATDEADLDGAISVGEGIADQQGAAAAAENNSSPLQLIVITHDRRLVEHLHLACRPDYIYGLSKDENGVSRIKKHENVSAADQSGFYT